MEAVASGCVAKPRATASDVMMNTDWTLFIDDPIPSLAAESFGGAPYCGAI